MLLWAIAELKLNWMGFVNEMSDEALPHGNKTWYLIKFTLALCFTGVLT